MTSQSAIMSSHAWLGIAIGRRARGTGERASTLVPPKPDLSVARRATPEHQRGEVPNAWRRGTPSARHTARRGGIE